MTENICKRGFHASNKAYYSNVVDGNEVYFGMYWTDGGATGEMSMKWIDLGDYGFAPQLQVFNDGWKVLSGFTDLISKLAEYDNENISQDKFIEILLECGFTDLTNYKSPYEN